MNKMAKEMKRKMAIRKTLTSIRKYIETLTAQQDRYLELAKTAKMKGANSQYALALNGLKACMVQKKKAEEMMLNIEIASQMRDLTQMTSSFLGTLQMVSKDMVKTTKSMDFAKVIGDFETAMGNVENSTQQLDVLLDSSSASYEGMFSGKDSAEMEKMVMEGISSENKATGLDAEIQADLDKIDRMMKGERAE